MRSPARFSLLALLTSAILAVLAPAALAAPEFGVESFFASNCKVNTCAKGATPAEDKAKAEAEGYSQAAGHPPFGVTDFKLNSKVIQTVPFTTLGPVANLKSLRIDVAPGVSTNPEAVPKCSVKGFTATEVEPVKHIFSAPECPTPGSEESVIGANEVITVLEVAPGVFADVPLSGKVYNLVQPTGMSSYFGVALQVGAGLFVHTFIEGHVEWASDYHDLFEIHNIPPGLLKSRLIFNGNIGTGGFLSNPSNCAGPGPSTTTRWSGESVEGAKVSSAYTTPIGTEGCNGLPPFALAPFAPTFSLAPETTQSDQPDGATTALVLPHDPNPAHLDSAQLKTATVLLPEGMTLNPSAAHGLEACTPAQIGIHTREPVTCPAGAKVAEATLNVPGLPPGSLVGSLYLGGPVNGPITGPPYIVYLDLESARYGLSVRLRGEVVPNESTGRLSVVFAENPEQPFSDLILKFTPGALAPLANPLVCGTATTTTALSPYTGQPLATPFSAFTVDGNGHGGACPSPLPFSLSQSTQVAPATAGSQSSFTFNLGRADGQQYLSRVSATLPPGLVGLIPSVPLCAEPQAAAGTCSAASQIGTATTTVGAGATPTQFSGPVYLTGPVGSSPYGMTVAVPAVTGPFNLGTVVVRTGIDVNPYSGRVTVSGNVPTIVRGIPLRLRTLSMAINRQGFLINPTNCGVLATDTVLGSTMGASQSLSTPFQVSNCSALGFKPKFTASANAATASKKNGIGLVVKIGYPTGPQANIRSVVAQLPKQLPSRLTTLQKACPEATFNASPWNCPSSTRVGGATVTTPVLPAKLTGPAFFVSHGGQAFPDLDLVLTGNGVEVILVGNTNITKGITTSTFASVPDVPVSSFELNLPVGSNSALTANGVNLCGQSLSMPTTITAQSGAVIKQSTKIVLSGCGVKIGSHRAKGHTAILSVTVPEAGRVSGSGPNLKTTYRHTSKAQKITLKVPLTSAGVSALRRNHKLKVKLRVGFIPRKKGPSSRTFATVTFHG
ncbi:MAG TPA: hypothetical protein VGY76_11490 [Solirubrobacteraceae bacterium]|jgi:hypothetical protein|nr:hypothetical protein [Solirubrobacteraceae bacterium]